MLFASDLDNTLIHSYKTAGAGDICVEVKDGKKLSFMSPAAYGLLREAAAMCRFVPVTTRSWEQYRRLDLGVTPRCAVVAHGALLIVDGESDEVWQRETERMLGRGLPWRGGEELRKFGKLGENLGAELEKNPEERLFDIRYVDGFFMFAKSAYPLQAVESLRRVIDRERWEACAVHNKVYVFPRGLTKGTALKRLKERFQARKVFSAGDSELDRPMLELADMAVAPCSLGLSHGNAYSLETEGFASGMLRIALEWCKAGNKARAGAGEAGTDERERGAACESPAVSIAPGQEAPTCLWESLSPWLRRMP